MLAYDYPLLGMFRAPVFFSLFVLVLFSIAWALFDNFRRRDHSGWAKAGWFLFPLLGVFVYLVALPPEAPARPAP